MSTVKLDPKQRKIVDAAQQLFVRHGYKKVTMSDIAEASAMSRPSLYAAYENKLAVLTALLDDHTAGHVVAGRERLSGLTGLRPRLEALVDEWILAPFGAVIGQEHALDLLANIGVYAPEGVDRLYAAFETELTAVLAPEMAAGSPMEAADLARIVSLAVKGLKATTETLPDLMRLTAGLVTMAIATARGG